MANGYNYDRYLKYLRSELQNNQIKVNCLCPILQKSYNSNETLSVIGKCEPFPQAFSYVNGLGETTDIRYWYGLHPHISVDKIFKAISEKAFYNSCNFENFLSKHKDFFTISEKYNRYAKALFAKTIVKMLTNFGVKLKADRDAFDHIKRKFEEAS